MLIDYQKVNIYQDDELILKEANFKADRESRIGKDVIAQNDLL